MNDPLSSMIEALGLEVAAIRQGGGGVRVALAGGSQVGQSREAWLYRFTVSQNLELRDETPVRLTVGANDVPGTLVTLSDGVLTVALEQDLGSTIDTARLVANDSFLVERLKQRLEEVRSGDAEFNRKSANRVVGTARVRAGDAEPERAVTADWTPNPDQLAAVRRSLGSDTTFIWGPPGSGKTTTVARLVEAHYRAGRSVLLVSNTNVAVDTALEKVAQRLKGESEFYRGLVLRHGPIVKQELEHRLGDQVSVEKVVATLGEALREEESSLETEQAPLKDEARALQEALQDGEALALARRTLADREARRARAAAIIAEREREAEHHRAEAVRLRRDLGRVRAMGVVRRFFSSLRPEVLERSAWEAEQAAHAASSAAAALRSDLPVHRAQIESLRREIERLDARLRNAPRPAESRARLDELHDRLVEIGMRLAQIAEALQELQQQVLDRCRVLATTVYRTYAGVAPLRRFDVVVIDEASMLVPPLVYFVAGLATRSVTVVGDFRQLPPIVISDEPLAAEWLRCDVFEKAGIPERVERRRPTPYLVALGTQYRMCEPICELVNSLFYTSRPLATHPSANGGGEPFPFGSSPLLYVDTGPYHPWAALREGSYSRYSLFHALLIHNLVLRLADSGFLPDGHEPNDAVGVIAPYAAQASLIQTLLDDSLGDRASGMSATVHRFQGNERSAMVLDLTDSLGTRLGRFLRAKEVDEVGARLLNVAASRARRHVVLVANLAYLRSKASPRSLVRRMADHFTEHGEPVDVTSLLPYGGAESVPCLADGEPPRQALGCLSVADSRPRLVGDPLRGEERLQLGGGIA